MSKKNILIFFSTPIFIRFILPPARPHRHHSTRTRARRKTHSTATHSGGWRASAFRYHNTLHLPWGGVIYESIHPSHIIRLQYHTHQRPGSVFLRSTCGNLFCFSPPAFELLILIGLHLNPSPPRFQIDLMLGEGKRVDAANALRHAAQVICSAQHSAPDHRSNHLC
jgi:hypothetical protein